MDYPGVGELLQVKVDCGSSEDDEILLHIANEIRFHPSSHNP